MSVRLNIRCTKNAIHIEGANNIGSTSVASVSTKENFMRVCEHWWNVYCESDEEERSERNDRKR